MLAAGSVSSLLISQTMCPQLLECSELVRSVCVISYEWCLKGGNDYAWFPCHAWQRVPLAASSMRQDIWHKSMGAHLVVEPKEIWNMCCPQPSSSYLRDEKSGTGRVKWRTLHQGIWSYIRSQDMLHNKGALKWWCEFVCFMLIFFLLWYLAQMPTLVPPLSNRFSEGWSTES